MRNGILLVCFGIIFFISPLFSQIQADIDGNARVEGRLYVFGPGTNNTFVGFDVANGITTGSENTVLGYRAGYLLSTGGANTYFGYESGRNNTIGDLNVAIGRYALANSQELSKNVAIGDRALLDLVDAFGQDPVSGDQDLGTSYNVAIGCSAGQFTNDPAGVDAERNTFIGGLAGLYNTLGYRNTFVGFYTGQTNSTGDYITCVGNEADVSSGNFVNAGAIGANATVNASNKIRIGNASITTVEAEAWSTPSDGRFKEEISAVMPGLDFVMGLRPVTYYYNPSKYLAHIGRSLDNEDVKKTSLIKAHERAHERRRTGFIAQEVELLANQLHFDFNGIIPPGNEQDNYGINYGLFVVPLVKAVQEQQAIIEALLENQSQMQKEIDTLKRELQN